MQTKSAEPTTKLVKVKSRCSICNAEIIKINYRPDICKNCKTNIAYISRNYHDPTRKISNLKIRLAALTHIKNNPKVRVTEALRQAVNYLNSTAANQVK